MYKRSRISYLLEFFTGTYQENDRIKCLNDPCNNPHTETRRLILRSDTSSDNK